VTEFEPNERRLTTDRETIREWATEYDVVPARTTDTETTVDSDNPYWLRSESERIETTDTLSWDEFFQQIEDDELVVVFHGESADPPLEVIDRDQAVSHAPHEASELKERLVAGETITNQVTETTVVERTIVENATIESEIVDTELLDSQVVGVEPRSRKIGDCDVVDRAVFDEINNARYDDIDGLTEGYQEELARPAAVEVDVEEDWTVTRELLERATIESRIVDVDVSGTDEVESETLGSIEIEGIQQALIDSDVIETEADAAEIIQSGTLESEFHEDDIVRTHLNQRRIVEDEVTEEKLVRGELTESELRMVETTGQTSIETGFVTAETLGDELSPIGVTEYGPATDAEVARDESERTKITADDEGKTVVAADGHTVGMVEKVKGGKAYINPEPGLVTQIKTKLGWGSADDEDFALEDESVERITDTEVELSVPK
jgi:hypothetical protein